MDTLLVSTETNIERDKFLEHWSVLLLDFHFEPSVSWAVQTQVATNKITTAEKKKKKRK